MKTIHIFLVSALLTMVMVPVAFGCGCQQKASEDLLSLGSAQNRNFQVKENFNPYRGY